MINNPITQSLLAKGEIISVNIFVATGTHHFGTVKCKISKIIHKDGDTILKLKVGKGYPFGHKYIFRSLEEVI
jgi:hypothetical protein